MITLRFRLIIVFISISILLLTLPLSAQVNPPVKNYPLKKLSGMPSSEYAMFSTWTATGTTTSHVTYVVANYEKQRYELKQFKLTGTGTLIKLNNDLHTSKGWVGECHSIWIANSGAPAGSGTVMVFIPANRDAEGTAMDFYMVGVDPATGQQVIPKKSIFKFKAPAGQAIHDGQVRVKRRGNIISVVIAISLDRKATPYNYSFAGKLYYLELNIAGYLRGQAKMVKVPNGGILQQFSLATPAHNGRGWIVPIYHTRMKTYTDSQGTGTRPFGSSLYILTATGTSFSSTKLKMRRIFSDSQGEYYTFRNSMFLPPVDIEAPPDVGVTKVKGITLDLFFVHRNMVPESQVKLDYFNSIYSIVPINARGKKAGSVTNVDIPKWDHQLTYDPARDLITYSDGVSNIVPSKDGRLYVSQARFLMRGDPDITSLKDADCEQEFNLYLFDRFTGEVEHVASTKRNWIAIVFNQLIRSINGRVVVLNHVLSYVPFKWEGYFSSFKQ